VARFSRAKNDILLGMWKPLLFAAGIVTLPIAAWAQAGSDDPTEILLRVRGRVLETIGRLPRYMCTLNTERAEYRLTGLKGSPSCDALHAEKEKGRLQLRLAESDRIRFDVAIGDSSREIYSWVGEDRFDDRGLFQLVRDGVASTGSYAGFLASVFGDTAADVSYNGDVVIDGRTLLEFGFQVSRGKSTYIFGNGRARIVTAYGGTFLVDPVKSDLVRLEVRTSQLPADIGSCEATTTLDYNRVRINDLDFLLPREVQLEIVDTNGDEWHNRTAYSACHEFRGESKLSFDEAPSAIAAAPGKASASAALTLPEGSPFTVTFTQAIDLSVASVGDPVKGKLSDNIRDSTNKVLIPEGSEIRARIVKLEHFYAAPSWFTVGFKLESVVVNGTPHTLVAAVNSGGRRFEKQAGLTRRVPVGTFASLEDPGIAIMEFRDTRQDRVLQGLKTAWRTVAPSPR
jgi:hypothetical protein